VYTYTYTRAAGERGKKENGERRGKGKGNTGRREGRPEDGKPKQEAKIIKNINIR